MRRDGRVADAELAQERCELVEVEDAGARVSARLRLPPVTQAPDQRERGDDRHERAEVGCRIEHPFGAHGLAAGALPFRLDDHRAAVAAQRAQPLGDPQQRARRRPERAQPAPADRKGQQPQPEVQDRQLEPGDELGGSGRPVAADRAIPARAYRRRSPSACPPRRNRPAPPAPSREARATRHR